MEYPLSTDYSATTTVSYRLDYGDLIVKIPDDKTVDLDAHNPDYDGLYLIFSPSGICALVSASHEQGALESAADKELLEYFYVDSGPDDEDEPMDGLTYLNDDRYDLACCSIQKIASMDVVATLKL